MSEYEYFSHFEKIKSQNIATSNGGAEVVIDGHEAVFHDVFPGASSVYAPRNIEVDTGYVAILKGFIDNNDRPDEWTVGKKSEMDAWVVSLIPDLPLDVTFDNVFVNTELQSATVSATFVNATAVTADDVNCDNFHMIDVGDYLFEVNGTVGARRMDFKWEGNRGIERVPFCQVNNLDFGSTNPKITGQFDITSKVTMKATMDFNNANNIEKCNRVDVDSLKTKDGSTFALDTDYNYNPPGAEPAVHTVRIRRPLYLDGNVMYGDVRFDNTGTGLVSTTLKDAIVELLGLINALNVGQTNLQTEQDVLRDSLADVVSQAWDTSVRSTTAPALRPVPNFIKTGTGVGTINTRVEGSDSLVCEWFNNASPDGTGYNWVFVENSININTNAIASGSSFHFVARFENSGATQFGQYVCPIGFLSEAAVGTVSNPYEFVNSGSNQSVMFRCIAGELAAITVDKIAHWFNLVSSTPPPAEFYDNPFGIWGPGEMVSLRIVNNAGVFSFVFDRIVDDVSVASVTVAVPIGMQGINLRPMLHIGVATSWTSCRVLTARDTPFVAALSNSSNLYL